MPPLKEQYQYHQERAVSSMNLSSQSFKVASSTATSSQSGRSPIVGTTLGKFILAAKGKSNNRQLAGLKGAPYYDQTKIENFELMKDVQSWIEENSQRCNPNAAKLQGNEGVERQLLKQYSKRAMTFPLNFIDPQDEDVTRGVSEDNIFFQGFKVAQKSDLQTALSSQGGPRRNVRLIHLNNIAPSQISQELSYSSSSVPSRKGQRNGSAIPQRESSSVVRSNKGLKDGNLFLHGGQDDSPFILHPGRRHEQLLDRILRASQNGGQLIKGNQNRLSKEAENKSHQDQLKTPDSRQVFDPWLGLEVRCMGPIKQAPDNLQGTSKLEERKIKGIQHHQGFHIKRNNAAIYIHMNEKKLQTQDLQAKELKLIGNQCQSKVSPEVIINNLQLRKSSQDNLDARELLLFLQRRYHEFPSKGDFDGRMNSIKQRMEDMQKQVYSERDRSTEEDNCAKQDDSVEVIDPCVSITKIEQSHSRQPPVCHDNQDRAFATQVQHSQSRHKKLLSVIGKKTQDPESHRISETQQKPLYKLNLINQKPKKLGPKPKGETAPITATPDTVQALTDQQDNIRKAQVRLLRPSKKITPLFANPSANQSSCLESDEERIERMHRFQKEIKAKYNDISMTVNNSVKEEPYKYVIIRGNNSELVKKCLDERGGDWHEIQSTNTLFHFKWSPFSRGIKFDYLTGHGQKKMVNHFEAHEQMTEKDNLYLNLSKYCETKRKNVFSIHPVTFVIDFSQQSSFNEIERFQVFFNILEKNKEGSDKVVSVNKEITSNHILSFPRSKSTNKYQVCENMFDGKNFWLIKPTDQNRGRGVQVFNTLEQFRKLIIEYQQGVEVKFPTQTGCASDRGPQIKSSDIAAQVIKKIISQVNTSAQQGPAPPDQVLSNFSNLDGVPNIVKTDAFVVQKYLERPFLISNRKFDIRLWVLITQESKVFLFKEGYIRTSSFAFDISPESIDKPFIHLTNNAVQRFNERYGAFEEGNQLSYQQTQELLKADGKDCDIYSIVNGPVVDIILETIKSVESKINQNNRKYCMELFGYDFILDQDMKPWLIEVNTNPCLEESSGLLKILLPRMLDDALKLTVDLVFPPKKPKQNQVHIEPAELQIASEPGHGFKEDEKKRSAAYKCEGNERAIGVKSNVSLKQTVITEPPKDSQKSKYHVDGHSDCESMWGLIYQLKV